MALQAFNAEVFGYREIFDYANDAMIIHCAHTGDVLEVNRQACQLYGIEREALIGLRVGDLARGSETYNQETGLKVIRKAYEEDVLLTFEWEITRPDGSYRPVECNLKRLGGQFSGLVLAMARDITDRLRREEEDRQRDQDLNHLARLSLAGEVSAAIAHELNQPLCAAVNYFAGCRNRLARETHSRAEVMWGMEMAQKELERAGKVVSVIRNFTTNKRQSPKVIGIREMVESAYEIIKVQIQSALAQCDLNIQSDARVLCDVVLMQQVISNLVANSLDSMVDNDRSSRRLSINVHRVRADTVEVSVVDQGAGVPEYLKEDHFYKMFYTTKEGGLGLGLSLCRKIVKSHRGTLKITDRTDGERGTVVSFTLPAFDPY